MTPLENALDLAARGAYVFPCQEYRTTPEGEPDDRKKPKPGIFWGRASTRDPAQIERWWSRWPDALIGLDLGKMGIFVADADRKPGRPDGVQGWLELCAEHGYSDADVPRVSTASQGEHLYFRQPEGAPIGNKKVGVSIDGRGAGGYVIAPGSRFTDDESDYRLMSGDIMNPAPMPQWLVDRLRASQAQPLPQTPANVAALPVPTREPGNREAAYASRAIEEEARTLAGMGKDSGRNIQLNTAAFNLGQLVAGGLLDVGEVRAALVDACHQNGLVKEDGMRTVLATIRSGLSAGARSPRKPPEQEAAPLALLPPKVLARAPDGGLMDAETGEVDDDEGVKHVEPDDVAWREPQGLIKDIAEWVMAVSSRPNWPLAIGAAISTMATLTSRHIITPERGMTHLYVVSLGKTGVGKDNPLKTPERIIKSLDRYTRYQQFERVLTSGDFKSATAIEETLASCPARLAVVDEIQQLFQRFYSKRASSFEASISARLQSLWSVSPRDDIRSSPRAGAPSVAVNSPALNIYGASTPQSFYNAMAEGAIENGQLNRWLFLYADKRASRRRVEDDPNEVPEAIIRRLLDIFPPGFPEVMNAGPAVLTVPGECITHKIPWTKEAEARWERLIEEILSRTDKDESVDAFYGRTAEMALRLATIHAVGRAGRSAVVEIADIVWGSSLALHSASRMIVDAADLMSSNTHQADYLLIKRLIKEAGRNGIIKSDLTKKIKGRIKPMDVKSIIASLSEANEIEAIVHPDDKPERGPTPQRLRMK